MNTTTIGTTVRTMILGAAALTMGSAAYGQTRNMTAEIPFSFRLNGTELPAGKYSIARENVASRDVVELNNGQGIKLALGHTAYGDERGQARLVFSCRDGSGCTLVQAWYAHGVGLEFHKPKGAPAENERMAVVVLRKSEAE